jgi:hypothetical protein
MDQANQAYQDFQILQENPSIPVDPEVQAVPCFHLCPVDLLGQHLRPFQLGLASQSNLFLLVVPEVQAILANR